MLPLLIQATEFSPEVILDPVKEIYMISGESRPENAGKFYTPIIQWFEQYKSTLYEQKKGLDLELNFEYFNSSSAKYILEILLKLEDLYKDGIPVKVKWYYDATDIEIKTSGEYYEKMIELPFEYVQN